MKNSLDLPQGENNSKKQILTTVSTKEKGVTVGHERFCSTSVFSGLQESKGPPTTLEADTKPE